VRGLGCSFQPSQVRQNLFYMPRKQIKEQNKNTFSLDFYLNLCYSYYMKITEEQINKFVEDNDMMPLGGDMFEDAGGHVWHESNIEDEIKNQIKE
jgi:hypothetical protein